MNKVVGDQMELKTLSDDFLDEFIYGIEKNNGSERFQEVVQFLVGFGNNYGCRSFEVGRPMT